VFTFLSYLLLFGGLLARIAEYFLNGSPREVEFHRARAVVVVMTLLVVVTVERAVARAVSRAVVVGVTVAVVVAVVVAVIATAVATEITMLTTNLAKANVSYTR
jgi:hypothetical protein